MGSDSLNCMETYRAGAEEFWPLGRYIDTTDPLDYNIDEVS